MKQYSMEESEWKKLSKPSAFFSAYLIGDKKNAPKKIEEFLFLIVINWQRAKDSFLKKN